MTDDGTTVTVPFDYADAGHLTHGYAMTIHKTQGATIHVALVLVDETMTREQLYTALSRGRLRNVIYISIGHLQSEIAHIAEARRDPLQALIGIIGRTDTKDMAIDLTASQ
jgi:ATP-dependent exoDNAse (exonuclease V) alpha subunit